MKRILFQVSFLLVLAISISAQTDKNTQFLFDELGEANLEDIMARLDNLDIALQNNPNGKAHIKVFGGDKNYFATSYSRGSLITAYLKNNRKLSPERYSIEYCNVNKEELRTQFFIVPQSEQFAKCDEDLKTPTNSVLFESINFYFPEFTFTPLENMPLYIDEPNGKYSQVSHQILKKLLDESPQSKIYLIGYLGTNLNFIGEGEVRKLDKPKVLTKIFREVEKEFVKNGIKNSAIIKINGGYKDSEKSLDVWFVPQTGDIPQPKPDYFPKRKTQKKK